MWTAVTVVRTYQTNLMTTIHYRSVEIDGLKIRHRRYLHDIGKSLFVWDCVVDLRGLELRANHAVAIEPISDL